jgi:hypothetical protein
MEAEALPLVNILDLKEDVPPRIAPPAPAVSYTGEKFGITINVVRNGEGHSPFLISKPHLCRIPLPTCAKVVV